MFWTSFSFLLYLFFFSSFGYFHYNMNLDYKKNLLIENENIENENQILQEKILRLQKTSKQKNDQLSIILFKFQNETSKESNSSKMLKYYSPFLQLYSLNHYLYLYIFIVLSGYIYIFLASLKRN